MVEGGAQGGKGKERQRRRGGTAEKGSGPTISPACDAAQCHPRIMSGSHVGTGNINHSNDGRKMEGSGGKKWKETKAISTLDVKFASVLSSSSFPFSTFSANSQSTWNPSSHLYPHYHY